MAGAVITCQRQQALLRAGLKVARQSSSRGIWGRDDAAGQADQTWPRKIEDKRAEALAFGNVHVLVLID